MVAAVIGSLERIIITDRLEGLAGEVDVGSLYEAEAGASVVVGNCGREIAQVGGAGDDIIVAGSVGALCELVSAEGERLDSHLVVPGEDACIVAHAGDGEGVCADGCFRLVPGEGIVLILFESLFAVLDEGSGCTGSVPRE